MNNNQKDLDTIIKLLRSMLVARKPPCPLKVLLSDYEMEENRELPYKAFNYKTPEEFLLKTGEFRVEQMFGELHVYAKANKKSAHIAALVREQKVSRTKPRIRATKLRSKKTPKFQRPGISKCRKSFTPMLQQHKVNESSNLEHLSPILQQREHQKLLLERQKRQLQFPKECNQNFKEKPQLVDKSQNTDLLGIEFEENEVFNGVLKSIKGRLKNLVLDVESFAQPQAPQLSKQNHAEKISTLSTNDLRHRLNAMRSQKEVQRADFIQTDFSKQNHAEKISTLSKNDLRHRLNAMRSQNEVERADVIQTEVPNLRPILRQQNSVGIHARNAFSSNEITKTSKNPQQSVAKKSIRQLKNVEECNMLPNFPNDKEFLDVLYKKLIQHPKGITSDKLSEWFVDKFGYIMPDNLFLLVKRSSRFIIRANDESENDYSDDLSIELAAQAMKTLELPWAEKFWDLLITYCASTKRIWGIFNGKKYNERFKSFTAELNIHMSNGKIRPDVIALKHIYFVERHSSWHRVRVESLDMEKQKAFCFHIDFGYTNYVPVDKLYHSDPKFLFLPPQAVPLSLFGLEDMAGNPYALKYLQDVLLYKAVIGKVVTHEADFEANGVIQMVIFDKSTEVEMNLNLLLQEVISKNSLPPHLKCDDLSFVNITNIDSDNGEVSMQILNADFEYVRRTLNQIVVSKLNREQHKCSFNELRQHQLLLVSDCNQDIGWSRAKLIDLLLHQNTSNGQDKMVDVMYIDYNIKRRVHISNIYRLESLSMALSKFPPQAVRVKLYGIPKPTQNIIDRMRVLLPENCKALVCVEVPEDVPHVTILRRVNIADTLLKNINNVLKLMPSTHNEEQSSTQLFCSSNPSSAVLPPEKGPLPKLREYDVKLPMNAKFVANVILVSNPQSFTVQLCNHDLNRLLNLMEKLQEYCTNNDAYIPANMIEIGQAYAAKKENNYYRVIAKSYYGDMINVYFCDYGNVGTINTGKLKFLPSIFRQLPIMGINAGIYGIKKNKKDVWSTDDVKRFRDLVLGKQLTCFLKETKRDDKGTIKLSLDLVAVQGEKQINIRQILLNEKRALPTTASKEN